MNNVLVINSENGEKFSRAIAERSAQWFEGLLSREFVGQSRKPRISLVVRSRFVAAKWIIIALLNDCIVNPINPDLPMDQIKALLNNTECDLLVTDFDFQYFDCDIHINGAAFPDVHLIGNDFSKLSKSWAIKGDLLLYTSGTTGVPKGVLLKAENLRANVQTAIESFQYGDSWVTASVLPMFHTFTIISDILVMLASGGTCVVCHCANTTSLPSVLKAFDQYKVRSYSAVPILFKLVSRFGIKSRMSSLSFGVSGAAPLTEKVRKEYIETLGHPIVPCYGMTEATCFISISTLEDIRPGSVGKPIDIDVVIFNDGAKKLPTGERGQIALKGPSVIADGYFKSILSHQDIYIDSYFLTGDIGYIDENGFLFITGRQKNMMIKAGEKFYLEDMDSVALSVAGVRDAASIVLYSDTSDDDAACFLETENGIHGDVLISAVKMAFVEAFGSRAVPSYMYCIEKIPRSSTGKAQIAALKAEYESYRQPEVPES